MLVQTKTLLLDIETAPNKAYVWGLFDQNIAPNQVEESGYVLCWSARWLGQSKTFFQSRQRQGAKPMLKPIHELLDEADSVVHYNGLKFDIPTLQKEFLKEGFAPPAPFKQVDLMLAVKRAFRFESNRLEYVCSALGLGKKVEHPGFTLWVGCMNGDQASWKLMEKYNRGDVELLRKLYHVLLPWLDRHPNMSALMGGREVCPKCGSQNVESRGTVVAITRRYRRFACKSCGGWFRSTVSLTGQGARTTHIGG